MATENGSPELLVSLDERDRRWELAREFMREHDLDALVLTGQPMVLSYQHWISNDYTARMVVFPREGEPVYIAALYQHWSRWDQKREGLGPWIEREEMGPDAVAKAFGDLGLTESRVGAVGLFGTEMFPALGGGTPYRIVKSILDSLPNVDFVDVTVDFGMIMLRKSDEEIALARRSGEICDDAARAMRDAAGVGATESELCAAGLEVIAASGSPLLEHNLYVGREGMGTGWRWFLDRPVKAFEAGDWWWAEMFAFYGGVEAQIALGLIVGEPSDVQRRSANACRTSYEIGLNAIRPGVPFNSIGEAMLEPILEGGFWASTVLVHTLNPIIATGPMLYGLDKQDIDPALVLPGMTLGEAEFDLEPNMLLMLEPSAGHNYTRLGCGGTVRVTEDGVEELSTFASEVHVV